MDYVNGAGADYSYAAAGRLLYVDNSTNNGQHKSRPELAEEGNRGQIFLIHCPAQAVPATGESEKRKRRFRGVTGAPCPSGRTAVSDPSVQRASKIPGRPCVGGNPGRTAHQRRKNISIRHGSRLAPKRWKRWRVPAATQQREPRDEAQVGVPAPSARSNQVRAAGPPLVPGSSRGFPGTQGLPEIFLTDESAGFDPAVTCGREDTIRLSPEPPLLFRG